MYRYFNHLSLDVVIGGVISYLFFIHFLSMQTNAVALVLLGTSIWIIYTIDHIADTRKAHLHNERRTFHNFSYPASRFLIVLLIGLNSILVFWLDKEVLIIGILICAAVLIYLLSIHLFNWKKYFHKEGSIAFLYCAGILVDPLTRYNGEVNFTLFSTILTFFLTVFLNLQLFSILDFKEDFQQGFPSLSQSIGLKNANLLFLVTSIITLFFITLQTGSTLLFMSLMFFILQYLFWRRNSSFVKKNFRYLGDGIFYLPIIGLL